MTGKLDGGEAILEGLRTLGVDHIIASPGSEWAPLWEALARQAGSNRPGPDWVECWHESLALAMAVGYTRVTNRPQAVVLHAGCGLLQGAMALSGALISETPMVVMSGESTSAGTDPGEPIEQQWYNGLNVAGGIPRLVEPLVKRGSQVTHINTLFESVVRAGELAWRTPRGPVYLDMPIEVMLQDWTPPAVARSAPAPVAQVAPAAAIAAVAAELAAARLPMIVAEQSGREPEAFAALVELAEALAIPVIGGKGTTFANFPKDHPMDLGMGSYGLLAEADLVLLVGGRAPWNPPDKRPTPGRIVAIDDNPIKREMSYQVLHADAYLEGGIAASLRALAREAKADPALVAARRQRWSAAHAAHVAALRATEAKAMAQPGITVPAICAALNRTAAPGTIFVEEAVTNAGIVQQHLRWNQPHGYIKSTNGLGQGTGVALGAKLAARERPVVLLVGDGSFLYNPVLPALGAARDHKLPILILVLNNGRYAAMRQGHVFHYPEGESMKSGHWYGVEIDGFDYSELAREFGFHGRKVERTEELEPALSEAFAALAGGRSAILNVVLAGAARESPTLPRKVG